MKIKTTIYMMIAAMICGIFVGCSGHKAALSLATEGGTWHDMTLPVKLSLKSPTSFSMGGRATIVRDSVVYMSFRVLGFEAAVLNVTADSVFFVDKYHKYFFAESMDAVLGHYRKDMGIGHIQELLMGRSPLAVDNVVSFGATSTLPVRVTYSNYENAGSERMARSVGIDATMKKTDVRAAIEWSPSSARCNTFPQVRFRRPGKGYRNITIAEAQHIFKNITL